VIVTIVLLKVALTCATPLATLLRTFFFFAIVSPCFSRLRAVRRSIHKIRARLSARG
jgi:hypothetical protein